MRQNAASRSAVVLAVLWLGACASPVAIRYYALDAGRSAPASVATATAQYRVAIGPATVPEAIDRQQLVLRDADQRYSIADGEQWSEPLKRAIPRVLAGIVGGRLSAARVAAHDQYGGSGSDYQVLLDVLRMDSTPGVAARLQLQWRIHDRAGAIVAEGGADLIEKPAGASLDALVAAHGNALQQLGGAIADSLTAARSGAPQAAPKPATR